MRREVRNRAIFDEWDRVVFGDPTKRSYYSPESPEVWQRLWDDHIANGNLAYTHLDDAGLICTLGWALAMAIETSTRPYVESRHGSSIRTYMWRVSLKRACINRIVRSPISV